MPRPSLRPGETGRISYAEFPGRVQASAYVQFPAEGRRRVKASGADEAAAHDALVTKIALELQGVHRSVIEASMPVADLALVWLASLRGKSDATVAAYSRSVRLHILPAAGSLVVGDAAPEDVEPFLVALEASSPAAGRVVRVILRSMFSLAVSAGARADNPVGDPAPSARGRSVPRTLSRIDFYRLRGLVAAWQDEPTVGGARSRDLLPQLDLLLGSGARRVGEALAVSWEDLDLEAGSWAVSGVVERSADRGLHVRAYGEAERYVLPLPAFVVDSLRSRGPGAGLVFPSRSGGPVDPGNFRRALAAAAPEFAWVKPGSLASPAGAKIPDLQ